LRVYAKELERLFLWCNYVRGLNIASLKRDDLVAYQSFLKKPAPKKIWCGSKAPRCQKNGEINPEWRVFYSGLSEVTMTKVSAILDTFFNYLVQGKYLLGNPMAMDRRRKKSQKSPPKIIDRYLELDEIHAVLKALSDYPIESDEDEFRIVRARYIILLLFYTGLRISEASGHTMGNFLLRNEEWFLRVIGKGRKLREIPIPDELIDAMEYYRKAIGLPSPRPEFREKTPLIPMQNLTQAISTRRIDQILKWAFGLGAHTFELKAPHKASKLQAASAHWLRHSYVTYLLNSGASLKVAQENAGHSNIATTMHYRHVNQTDRHQQTRKLSLKKSPKKSSE
jgi:site-specific recombinase XerD